MTKMKPNQAGFTLVELSIVLVIIGLIIGGVLTGRQIMQNAQIANTVNAIQAYQAEFQAYMQNYGAIPGNDSGATTRFPGASVSNGSGLGTLTGAFDNAATATTNVETNLVWADLRAANLVKNQPAGAFNTAQPSDLFGGIFGFQHGAFSSGTSPITSNVLCLNNVPADVAAAIDAKLDDGSSNTGTVQAIAESYTAGVASAAGSGTPSPTYSTGSTYTMCVGM